jgi:hypothetical protein
LVIYLLLTLTAAPCTTCHFAYTVCDSYLKTIALTAAARAQFLKSFSPNPEKNFLRVRGEAPKPAHDPSSKAGDSPVLNAGWFESLRHYHISALQHSTPRSWS